MEIRLCEKRTHLPPDSDVREIMKIIAHKAGFDLDRIRLTYIGGREPRIFQRRGIKLLRAEHWATRIFIGTGSQAVECWLAIIEEGGRSRSGGDVFRQLNRICDNHTFFIDEDVSREVRMHLNGHTEAPETIADEGKSAVPVEDTQSAEVKETSALTPEAPESATDSPASPPQDTLPEVQYDRYFDNPEKLHLVVCALVALVNEDCESPFAFSVFRRALEESEVPESAGPPMALVRAFMSRHYIVRINPNMEPARYTITEEAVTFARGPVPTTPIKPVRLQRDESKADTEKSSKVVQQRITRLRRIYDDHQKVLAELESKRRALANLREAEIEPAERDIEGQEKSLRKRLQELAEARLDLVKRRSEVALTKKRIAELTEESKDPEVKVALAEFEELKRLLG